MKNTIERLPLVNINNDGNGAVDLGGFQQRILDTGIPSEHFYGVDTFRIGIMAEVQDNSLDWTLEYRTRNPNMEGFVGVAVHDIPLGGDAKGSVVINSNGKLVGSIEYPQGGIMDKVLSKADNLFTMLNVDTNDEDEIPSDEEEDSERPY